MTTRADRVRDLQLALAGGLPPVQARWGPLHAPEEPTGAEAEAPEGEAPGAEAEGKKEAPSGESVDDLKAKIAELTESANLSKRERETLVRRLNAAKVVAIGDSADRKAFRESAFTVLTEVVGMSESEARDRLAELEEGEEEPEEPEERKPKGRTREPEPKREDPKVRELDERTKRLEASEKEAASRQLQQDTDDALVDALDSDKGYATLIEKVKANGKDPTVFGRTLRKDALSAMKDDLREKFRRSGGVWDDAWLSLAATKGVKAAVTKYQSALDALAADAGRASETDTGRERLAREKPKAPPTEDDLRTKGRERVNEQMRDWAADALLREVVGKKSGSRV